MLRWLRRTAGDAAHCNRGELNPSSSGPCIMRIYKASDAPFVMLDSPTWMTGLQKGSANTASVSSTEIGFNDFKNG